MCKLHVLLYLSIKKEMKFSATSIYFIKQKYKQTTDGYTGSITIDNQEYWYLI